MSLSGYIQRVGRRAGKTAMALKKNIGPRSHLLLGDPCIYESHLPAASLALLVYRAYPKKDRNRTKSLPTIKPDNGWIMRLTSP